MAKKKRTKVPKTGAQKGAEAALYAAQQVGVEAQRSRTRQASRGAFAARQLRSGGTSLQQYNLAKFKSDPFPALGGAPGLGSVGPASASSIGPRGATSTATSADGRKRIRQQENAQAKNRRKDNMSSSNNEELMQAKAAAKAKAKAAADAAKAKAKKKQQAKLTDSKGGTTKALGTKSTMS